MSKSRMSYITDLLAEYDSNDSIHRAGEIKNEIREFCRNLLEEIAKADVTFKKNTLVKSIVDGYYNVNRNDHYTCWLDCETDVDGNCVNGLSVLHEYYFRGEYNSGEYFIPDYIVDDVSKLSEYYGPVSRRVCNKEIMSRLRSVSEVLNDFPECDVLPEEIKEYLRTNF